MGEAFKDLHVWQRAVQLSVAIYKLTAEFPREEMFGLTSQMRRAAVSIASNIAEGWGRQSPAEYKRFLAIARGSNMELQTQLVIVAELKFGNTENRPHAESLCTEVSKMLVSLMRTVRSESASTSTPLRDP